MSLCGAIWSSGSEVEIQASLTRLAHSSAEANYIHVAPHGAIGATNAASTILVDGQHVIAFAGLLYEANALCASLGVPCIHHDAKDYAYLALSAYRRWGESFPEHLDGEFAFALWDQSQRRLLLGRDAVGQQPLFYSCVGTSIFFASEPRGLIGWKGLDCGIDDEIVVCSMILQPSRTRTLFRGIQSVPTGHVVIFQTERQPRTHCYWTPLKRSLLHLKDRREYADGIRAAMERAVAIRLPANGTVASMLSSGFDSSSVTALLARQMAEQGRPLLAYTSSPSHPTSAGLHGGRYADEWPLASQTAAMYPNIEHLRIGTADADWWEALDGVTGGWCGPPVFLRNFRWFYAILADAKRRGVSTLFEGSTGNMTGSYDGSFGLYDLLKRGCLLALARSVRLRRRHGASWKQILLRTWLPSARTMAPLRRAFRGGPSTRLGDICLVRPKLFSSAGLSPSQASGLGGVAEGDRRSGAHWRFSILQSIDMGMTNAAYARLFGIHRADPTADRQLIEFCLSIPDEAFCPGGVPRQLYRDAMQDVLPAALLQEPLRGLQSSDFVEMFDEWLPQFREEVERIAMSPLASRMLDVERMRLLLNRWPEESRKSPMQADQFYNFTVGGAITMGRFLRRFEQGLQR